MEPRKLYKSRRDRTLCGVCGGIAEYFGVDSTLIRLAAVLFAFISCGTAVLAYFVAAVIIPDNPEF
ncbi:MAG: PspC domain-containing protein [Suipraeoptans sp.]